MLLIVLFNDYKIYYDIPFWTTLVLVLLFINNTKSDTQLLFISNDFVCTHFMNALTCFGSISGEQP